MDKNSLIKNMGLSILLSTCAFEGRSAEVPRPGPDGMVIGDRHLRVGDGESAMDGALNDQIMKCFTVIYNNIPTLNETAVENAYNQVVDFVNSPDKRDRERPKPKILQLINGEFVVTGEGQLLADRLMYKNALHTLTYNGFWGSISQNASYRSCPTDDGQKEVKMKELLARVWVLINGHANPLHVGLMKDSLFANLNYCVEDGGDLTCDSGKTKRLIMSIEGYFNGISLTAVLPDAIDFCSQYDTEFFENLRDHHRDDPLNFAVTYEVPDNYSLADLENRIVREREVVRLRINGLYSEGSTRAIAAIELMEGYFDRWRQTYNDNAPSPAVNEGMAPVVPARTVNHRMEPNHERFNELLQRFQDIGDYFLEDQDQVNELERLGIEHERYLRAERERQTADRIAPLANAIRERLAAENRAEVARMQAAAAQVNAQPANPNRPMPAHSGAQQPGILRQPAATRTMFDSTAVNERLDAILRDANERTQALRDQLNIPPRVMQPTFGPMAFPQFPTFQQPATWNQSTVTRPTGGHLPAWVQPLMQAVVQPMGQPMVQPLFQSAGQQLTPKQAKAARKAQVRQEKRAAAQVKKAQKAQARQEKRAAAQLRKIQKAQVRQEKRAAAMMRKAQNVAARQAKKAATQLLKAQKAAQRLATRRGIAA